MNDVAIHDSYVTIGGADPHGMQLWLVFIAVWLLFWGTAGGIIGHKVKGRGFKGALLGASLAIVGIMLVVLQDDEPKG